MPQCRPRSRRSGIGDGTRIEGAIVDKNCRIGRSVVIANPHQVQDAPEADFGMVCDGLPVIRKGATLPDGWKLPT